MPPDSAPEIKFLDPVPPQLSVQEARNAALKVFGLEGELRPLYSERDQNFLIETGSDDYVLKISNEKEDPAAIDLQTHALLHMARTDPSLPIPKIISGLNGEPQDYISTNDGAQHLVRVLTFLPGKVIADIPRSIALLEDAGRVVGRSGLALRGFFHPAAGYDLLWDLRQLTNLRSLTIHLKDAVFRKALERDLDYTLSHILPQLPRFRSQIIHNDANQYNLIVDPEKPTKISGLVDFGDMLHAPLIFDLAVAAGSATADNPDAIDSICHLTRGYDSVSPLEQDEINILSHLTMARITQELLIAARRRAEDPDAPAYIVDNEDSYAAAADTLLSLGHPGIRSRLRDACRFPAYCPREDFPADNQPDDIEPLLKRRQASLGKTLELAYDKPLHVTAGEGVWLFDAEGKRYLDVYNNVPHVGHCHPHVVKAVSRQLATLNTNTRYLFDNVVSYAERLAASLPGELGSCIFVNSGSEANDAAMRIARTLSGRQGAIIIEDAYHGITESIDELSPAAYPGENQPTLAPRVRSIEAPNLYRGRFGSADKNAAQLYAQSVDIAIESLNSSGHGVAAFMVDSSFSSSGILPVLPGYLPAVCEKARAAGGFIIADEVQIGFGRCGSHLWGFEAQGIVPDIVTLGKPVGNGISLGVVVTTPEIRESFGKKIDFFSTFGGNPVACAAAHAVFDVIENEGLLENARLTGHYMREGLRNLAQKYDVIGDVRGQGLFTGIEIVRDRESREPAADIADKIRNRLRENQVLVGRETRGGNVIKARPPLVFKREHADIFLEAFEAAVTASID